MKGPFITGVTEVIIITQQEFTRLVEMFSGTVFRTALCYVKNKHDADDIMQEVFLKLYTYHKAFESDNHVKAWLIRVTANYSKNLLKSLSYRLSEPIEKAENIPADEHEQTELLSAIMELKPKNRSTMYIFYYEGYSVKEIAAILGEKETTVTTRLSRGRKQLKKLLLKGGYDELQ